VIRMPMEQLIDVVLSRGLRAGELTLVGRDGVERRFAGREPGPRATVIVNSRCAARRVGLAGAIGLAQGYMDGDWDTPDLDAVLDLGIANLDPAPSKPTLLDPVTKVWHRLRDNDVDGSRKNVAYHYDLGNEFYELWLDETMAYSSALFAGEGEALSDAQLRKWNRMLELLQPSAKDHLLEIGCGWGGFAIHAAKEAGCRVTGVTLSQEQHDWAARCVEEAGVEDRVDVRLQDYRHVAETYSGIVSIEMFEAVGCKWWPVFFGRLKDLLAPGGAVALQTITIEEPRFEDYRRHPDFIQRYIFPGGMLPSPERFAEAARREGLAVNEPLFFGDSYARTLSEWATRFEACVPDVLAMGFDERFVRMWRYYLAYCRAGFSAGSVDVMQVRLEG